MITAQQLRDKGYFKIKSDRQAYQLLRRELKKARATQFRCGVRWVCWEYLLDVKPGMWVKFYRLTSGRTILVIWRGEVDEG